MIELDVLVVYSSNKALSALVADAASKHPFNLNSATAGYNLPYSHFLETCAKQGIKAGFSASTDVIGPGSCQSYWTSRAGKWIKIEKKARSRQIFDKISPTSPKRVAERKLLLSTKEIQPFNNRELYSTFFDKQLTYDRLQKYSIPTVSLITKSTVSIEKSLDTLQKLIANHKFSSDFLVKFVLKDRFGSSGNHVYEISQNFVKKIQSIMKKNPEVQFVLQPFLAFDKGFVYKKKRATTDIRLIFHHDKILQCYLRLAKGNDFRCNEHQGGQLIYISSDEIPKTIVKIANSIVKKINHADSLYALDFIVSNAGNVYFLEGNFGPGLDWNTHKSINEKMSKQLIGSIVDEFSLRLKKAGNKKSLIL